MPPAGRLSASSPPPHPAAFFGWRVVGAAFIIAVFAWGIGFYGPPIFLQALHAGRGWPLATVSAAISAHFLLGAVVVARLPALHRRLGLVRATQLGGGLTALGLIGWAFAEAPWQLFLAAPVSGAGWAMTSGAAINTMVSRWFAQRRPAALGMAFNGASMGGVLFSPLWVALIGGLGFPYAALLVGAAVSLVLWILAERYLRPYPADLGQAIDGSPQAAQGPSAAPAVARRRALPSAAWRDRRFLTLVTSSTLSLFAQIGLLAHLFSLLVPLMGAGLAGALMGAVTACAILGRTLLGWLLRPGGNRRVVAMANALLQVVGSLVLLSAGSSVPLLMLGCALFGLGLGNVTSLPPLIAQAEFATGDVPRVVALVTAIGQAGYAFAPVLMGLLLVWQGDGALFLAAALIQLTAAAVLWPGLRRHVSSA